MTTPRLGLTIPLLAFAGGGVDAVVFLGFDVLSAAQTGNTVLFAVAVAEGQSSTGVGAAVSIAGFVFGTGLGALVIDPRSESRPTFHQVGLALLAELVALGTLLVIWSVTGTSPDRGLRELLIALAALGMGIQSAMVLSLHAGATTTYISGTLAAFAVKFADWGRHLLYPRGRPLPHHGRAAPSSIPATGGWLDGIAWLSYACGAVAGGVLYLEVGSAAVGLPIIAIVAATASEGLATRHGLHKESAG